MIELLLQAEGALSVGLLDRAEILYRQVAGADPRNAIAIVGLSRVALERGEQETALELARRALAIDVENVAAQRMVQRLEEVLAYRGIQAPTAGDAPVMSAAVPVPSDEPGATHPPAATGPNASAERASPAPPTTPATPRPPDGPGPRSLVDRLLRRR